MAPSEASPRTEFAPAKPALERRFSLIRSLRRP